MLVETIRGFIFAMALAHAYEVPLPYGVEVYNAAVQEDINPFELGALLMAENRGRHYDPETVGKYNGGGELGLFQLQPYPWSRVCGIKPVDLKHPVVNIHCAAKVSRHMMEKAGVDLAHPFWREALEEGDDKALLKGMRRKTRHGLDWQVAYRCSPKARTSKLCEWSVKRVINMHKALLKAYEARTNPIFWVWAAFKAPVLLQRTIAAAEKMQPPVVAEAGSTAGTN